MPDKDMAVIVKTLTDQNKAIIEMMKTESGKDKTSDPYNFAKKTS